MKEVNYDITTVSKMNSTRSTNKKTQFGWIPKDWSIKSLGELGEFSKGKGIAKKDILEKGAKGFPCIRYAEIYTIYENYTHSLKTKINEKSAKNSNQINNGDILFASSGETLEDIGKSVAYLGNEDAYAGGDIVILKQNSQDSQYLGYLLNNDIVKKQLVTLGQGHSVVHIYSSGLKKVLIPLPPVPQQKKISQILFTWDKAIAAQEQLIGEKQILKKGLIQQLLTGKKRFPGFEEEWSTPTISEVFDFVQTTSYSRAQLNYNNQNQIYYIHYGDIHSTYKTPILDLEKFQGVPKLNNDVKLPTSIQYLKNGDVIIADASEDYGGVGRAIELQNINEKKIIGGLHTFALRDKKGLSAKGFRAYIFKNPTVRTALKTIATGSKVYGISKGNVQKFQIVLPTFSEQKKIADILSNFDNEIEILLAYKNNLIQQKQGLMQQLLTGEKRVKI